MNQRNAIKIMLGLLIVVIIFHLSIILQIIPYEITWGGKLKSDAEMYVFETISIIINLFLGLILLIKGSYVKRIISLKAVHILLWGFFVLFGLNTVGNVFAKTNFEKSLAILTLISSILIWVILKPKNNEHTID